MSSEKEAEKTAQTTEQSSNPSGDGGAEAAPVLELKQDLLSSPMFILVTLMAYIALSGGKTLAVEKKAEFITTLRKHVDKEEMTETDIQVLMHDGFEETQRMEYRHFLDKVTPQLTYGQRLATLANLYDMMMVDGELLEGEESKIDLCRRIFEVDPIVARQIRRVMLLKNDTAIFLNDGHPGNDPGFRF